MKTISSKDLLERVKTLVSEERRVTLALIQCLEEIQSRMLYAELGYASLWAFATKYLGLSEGAAQRRIQAMRLTRDVPEAKASLASGKLSLSNAAKIQSFRQAEKKAGRKHDPRMLLTAVSDLSQRECEQKLFELSPQALPQERERLVSSQGERELRLVISSELYEKLQRIRGGIAHARPEASYVELLELMADETLAHLGKKRGLISFAAGGKNKIVADDRISNDADPASTAAAEVVSAAPARVAPASARAPAPESALAPVPAPTPARPIRVPPPGQRGYLPVAIRRALGVRSQGRCEVIASDGRRCSSRYRLEVDHVRPIAHRGSNELGNLRIACWHHNQQHARSAGLARRGD